MICFFELNFGLMYGYLRCFMSIEPINFFSFFIQTRDLEWMMLEKVIEKEEYFAFVSG